MAQKGNNASSQVVLFGLALLLSQSTLGAQAKMTESSKLEKKLADAIANIKQPSGLDVLRDAAPTTTHYK